MLTSSPIRDCINFFAECFRLFFAWLNSFMLFPEASYLTFVVGVFLVFLVVDNFVLKGK